MAMAKVEPVCAEPKVFVGQLPDEASQGDVQNLFQQYGPISDCSLIKGPDGRGRGFAMVQFQKWRDAEAAIERLNGTTSLGGSRTLVVKVADPPKRGGAPVGGIAPKKLFVGQIPTDTDEQQLRKLFEQHGAIKDLHLVRKSQPWFAFVTYDRWAEAEAAIEALNGQAALPNARSPLVVKFADGKPSEAVRSGEKRALGAEPLGAPQKRQFMGSDGGMLAGYGMMGYSPLGGMPGGRMMGRMGGMGMAGMNPMGMAGMGAMSALGLGAMGMSNGMYGMAAMPAMAMPGSGSGSPQQHMRNGRMQMGMGMALGGLNHAAARQWKLFVGQVPFEATEQDLWQLFGPLGDIVELVVLRHPGSGKSRGCAFVTYVNKESAQAAIDTIHEQQSLPGRDKVLVVKYANN